MASYEENASIWWCHHVMQNYALKWLYFLAKLRVYQHFEDAPRRPMITCTIDSYWIPSKNKTKLKLQIFAKTSNFRILKKLFTWYTFWSCLIRCVKKIWIRQVLLKIQSRHDSIHRRTDGWMDGQTDKVKPTIFQLSSSLNSNIHGANMGPTWVLSAPGGSHVSPMNLAIGGIIICDVHALLWYCKSSTWYLTSVS